MMKLACLLALLSGAAFAKPVEGVVKREVVYGAGGTPETLKLVFDVPSTLQAGPILGDFIVMKDFFHQMTFGLASSVPRNMTLNGKTSLIRDTSAKTEVLLIDQVGSGVSVELAFMLFRRLNPEQAKPLLVCNGTASDRNTLDALLKVCRSAKPK